MGFAAGSDVSAAGSLARWASGSLAGVVVLGGSVLVVVGGVGRLLLGGVSRRPSALSGAGARGGARGERAG